jgi:muramoyltetrapeptide carboxypeptidase
VWRSKNRHSTYFFWSQRSKATSAFFRYPAPLKVGSRIAITAPSSGVEPPLHARLDLNIAHLWAQGFVVEEGLCLRNQHASASASADVRAAELMHFLLRDDIDAIFPPWGGELAIDLLDRLDWAALQRAKPKWLIGYSDTSTLMLPITLRLGWATAHGPCLMDLAPAQSDALTRHAMAVLGTPTGASVSQRQSEKWQSKWTDFQKEPTVAYALTEPTQWRCLNRLGDDAGSFSGRLIGGCIDTLMHLTGTPLGHLAAFVEAHRADGVILYLENAEQSPTELVRALHSLRWSGWLNGLAGLFIGRSSAPDTTGLNELRYEAALQQELETLACPVLIDVDIGHLPPQLMLINGSVAHVSWSATDGGTINQTLI